jgi:hypothetical protein
LKVLIYTVLFSILFSLGARLQVCMKYAFNQDYYATVLCENKGVKNSCCKGQCAVQKELADLDKKEEQQPGKSGSSILKISKSSEILPASYRLCVYRPQTTWLYATPGCNTRTGNPSPLFRPPASAVVSLMA